MDLDRKNAVITGASQGIGAAIALRLAKCGTNVIIIFKSNKAGAERVLFECNKYSKNNMIIQSDISLECDVVNMSEIIKEKYKQIDILVNNAGIFDEKDGPKNIDVFKKIFETNFFGQINVINKILPLMNTGKIINISSSYGRVGSGYPEAIAYSSSKAALESYTQNLSKFLAPNILVNILSPGKTITPIWGKMSKDEEEKHGATQLINRFILPDEIAEGVLFLIRNDAICGEILTIDGGMSLKISDSKKY